VTARVLIVMPSLHRGGAERHCVLMATGIDRNRWQPHVLAFGDGSYADELRAAGIDVEIVRTSGGAGGIRESAAAVRRAVDRLEPALVTGQNIRVEVAVRGALRQRPVPYLAWKHTYGHVGHRGLRERAFEAATGRLVTAYGAVCHTQTRYLTSGLGLSAEKIVVLPNAVRVPPVAPPPPTGGPTVLMAAAMRADKNHAAVLRAWPEIRARVPGARLRLAGDGPVRPALEALAASLQLGPSVEFLGVRTDVDRLLAASRLSVLASYAVECFPYAVLEAMAAGRGVVSTDVAGLPEMVDDGLTGRLVPPGHQRALADAIVEGLRDGGATAAAWGAAGYRRAHAVYGLDGWNDRLAKVFDGVAGRDTTVVGDSRKELVR
jgi:glycosyltransferase involved in cell wall biosynthesis